MRDILQNKLDNMTPDEVLDNMYRDPITQVWNRRAFEQTPDTPYVALIDVDSLKWINDNKGHREGDRLLYKVAQYLDEKFPDAVFRISGDEFVVRHNDAKELFAKLKTGKVFSFGIGRNLIDADKMLGHRKAERTRTGKRAARGERPVYLQK